MPKDHGREINELELWLILFLSSGIPNRSRLRFNGSLLNRYHVLIKSKNLLSCVGP
jgi:hypothetical protein